MSIELRSAVSGTAAMLAVTEVADSDATVPVGSVASEVLSVHVSDLPAQPASMSVMLTQSRFLMIPIFLFLPLHRAVTARSSSLKPSFMTE